MNVYLFEKGISHLQMQKNARELEIIVQECILTTIRESIPTEEIIRAYMDESVEHEEEITIEPIAEPVLEAVESGKSADGTVITKDTDAKEEPSGEIPSIEDDMPVIIEKPKIENLDDKPVTTTLKFNDIDTVFDSKGKKEEVVAPKTIERLEEIGSSIAMEKSMKLDEEDEDQIKIHTESLDLHDIGIVDLGEQKLETKAEIDPFSLDIEEI